VKNKKKKGKKKVTTEVFIEIAPPLSKIKIPLHLIQVFYSNQSKHAQRACPHPNISPNPSPPAHSLPERTRGSDRVYIFITIV
jgi:hypothetical protein